MQITAFNPVIITQHADEIVALFEELGFERVHTKTDINDEVTNYEITSHDLKLGDTFRLGVVQFDKFDRDIVSIRMNVRDFDEAYDFLISKGFKNSLGDKVIHTSSSKSCRMVSPSGFSIGLAEHIRK